MPGTEKNIDPKPVSGIIKYAPLMLISTLVFLWWLHFGALREICFPASFTAFTGYTPEESIRLWEEVAQPDKRYTRCRLNPDNSISLFVTRSQQAENMRIYRESLQGWTARCRSVGVSVQYTADCRHISCLADSEKAWTDASGDLQAVQAALACLQIMKGTSALSWSVSVRVALKSDPNHTFLSYTIPGESEVDRMNLNQTEPSAETISSAQSASITRKRFPAFQKPGTST